MRKLRVPYRVVDDPEDTRSRILLEAARLFALEGYSTVSVRDIARATGIRPSSLYNHYEGKQNILEEIMHRIAIELSDFYKILDKENLEAQSFKEIIGNIFVELKESTNSFSYYALWCAMSTQFLFEASRHVFYDLFLIEGKKVIKRQLDLAISKEFIQPLSTEGIASFISSSVIMMMAIHTGIANGYYENFDIKGWYQAQADHLLYLAECGKK